MATILFAWELGGDYGHLARLLPIARALTERGHRPVFAVRDLAGAEALLAPHGITALQAPLYVGNVTGLPDPIGYAELLMRFGYLHPRALTGICRAWRALVDLLQPALVVLDHAPTALLATRGLPLPRLHLGDGFCIPPRERPLPPFRWWLRENPARLADSERHALASTNATLQALDAPPLVGLADLLDCDDTLFTTFPELDHYPQRRAPDAIGPIFALGQGAVLPWPEGEGPRVFAYLKSGYSGLDAVLAALQASKARVLAHVAGASRQTLQRHASATLQFSEQPLDMETMRRDCDLAVCHGGAGTTSAMLLAGKPLLLLPMQTEQAMTGRLLSDLGVASVVAPEALPQVSRLLRKALADTAPTRAAAAFAERHAGYDQQATVARAADRCEALIRSTP